MTHNRNREEQQIHDKYVVKSYQYHMQSTREESEAYNLAWEHAMQYVNELITLRNRKQLEQMSDEEFNAFLRNQLGSQN